MRTGRPKALWVLSAEQRDELEALTRSRSLPGGLVNRARIVLLSSDRVDNKEIARRLGLSEPTVGKWRKSFLAQGIDGLYDEPRPVRPRSISDEQVAELINTTPQTKPAGATHWTCRALAGETGVSKSTVQRVWTAFGLRPHRTESFKLSTDPCFVDKVRDIVGLYLDPPTDAIVLCMDEKSQCQALERTQLTLLTGQENHDSLLRVGTGSDHCCSHRVANVRRLGCPRAISNTWPPPST